MGKATGSAGIDSALSVSSTFISRTIRYVKRILPATSSDALVALSNEGKGAHKGPSLVRLSIRDLTDPFLITPCGHLFHGPCLQRDLAPYYHNLCPTCQTRCTVQECMAILGQDEASTLSQTTESPHPALGAHALEMRSQHEELRSLLTEGSGRFSLPETLERLFYSVGRSGPDASRYVYQLGLYPLCIRAIKENVDNEEVCVFASNLCSLLQDQAFDPVGLEVLLSCMDKHRYSRNIATGVLNMMRSWATQAGVVETLFERGVHSIAILAIRYCFYCDIVVQVGLSLLTQIAEGDSGRCAALVEAEEVVKVWKRVTEKSTTPSVVVVEGMKLMRVLSQSATDVVVAAIKERKCVERVLQCLRWQPTNAVAVCEGTMALGILCERDPAFSTLVLYSGGLSVLLACLAAQKDTRITVYRIVRVFALVSTSEPSRAQLISDLGCVMPILDAVAPYTTCHRVAEATSQFLLNILKGKVTPSEPLTSSACGVLMCIVEEFHSYTGQEPALKVLETSLGALGLIMNHVIHPGTDDGPRNRQWTENERQYIGILVMAMRAQSHDSGITCRISHTLGCLAVDDPRVSAILIEQGAVEALAGAVTTHVDCYETSDAAWCSLYALVSPENPMRSVGRQTLAALNTHVPALAALSKEVDNETLAYHLTGVLEGITQEDVSSRLSLHELGAEAVLLEVLESHNRPQGDTFVVEACLCTLRDMCSVERVVRGLHADKERLTRLNRMIVTAIEANNESPCSGPGITDAGEELQRILSV
ncbi:hypothetical protein KIPB_003135 [Kipferlia bialata]|uniref:Uncharacterized protein n=1 Tax=Kipferlia bialata TaxID=797122 RepID=A0A9K3GH82_9EUKA|nr:hypothetical protein KIPB_003135 [Kipferlia bialata]|eukprot:g3135.t1